ncbi:MAG: sigma-70 family RNA polymerase sigma factor [Planctomycetota bacterium]
MHGAQADLERWIAAFRGPLIGLLASWGLEWGAAEELAQDVFAEAWLGRARFTGRADDHANVGAWLSGIARNLYRTRRREATRSGLQALPADLAAAAPEEDERRAELVAAFAELSEAHQTVLRMHYLEETSAREVAALLLISPKAVEDRLYQARKALRERLERRTTAGGRR